MSFFQDIKTLTRHPGRHLLHPVSPERPRCETFSGDMLDRGGRLLANGATTVGTMALAAPVLGGAGLSMRAVASPLLRVKALTAPAFVGGALAGIITGACNVVVGAGAAGVGAVLLTVGTVAYPVESVSRGIAALAD